MDSQNLTLFAFTINFIFGAGVLSIPYAFLNGGIVSAGLTLVVASVLSLITALWLFEIQARGQTIKAYRATTNQADAESSELLSPPFRIFDSKQIEISELCQLFSGPKAKLLYDCSISLFASSSAWMYASISAVSLSKSFPILTKEAGNQTFDCDIAGHSGFLWKMSEARCYYDYLIYMAVFSLFQVYLIIIGIERLRMMQQVFTVVGLIALFTMITTVLSAMAEEGLADLDSKTIVFDINGYGSVFSTFVFAQVSSWFRRERW